MDAESNGWIWILLKCTVGIFIVLAPLSQGATQDDYYDLIDTIFEKYRKEVRPVTDDSSTTEVIITFELESIVNLDERNQVLTTSVIIEMMWADHWLTWDPESFGHIKQLRYPQEKLWLPDVIVANSVESQTELGYRECPCSISDDGLVNWRPSEIIETSCDMDVTYYPFDEQECSIILSTWVSPKSDILLDFGLGHDTIYLGNFAPSSNWELVSTSAQGVHDDAHLSLSRIQYNIRLKRRSSFYVLNIIIPVLLLSMTTSAVFYLPAEAGEKVGLSMTVLLAFAVYLTILSNTMPQNSVKVSILSVYLTILLGICGMSVFMSVFVLHLHHSPPEQPMGRRTKDITIKLRRHLWTGHKYRLSKVKAAENESQPKDTTEIHLETLEAYTVENRHDPYNKKITKVTPLGNTDQRNYKNARKRYTTKKAEKEKEHITWPVVAETIDSVFFLITSISIFVLTVIFMLILVYGKQ